MAEILRPGAGKRRGSLPVFSTKEYVGHELECGKCACLFRLDVFDVVHQRVFADGSHLYCETACPHCCTSVYFDERPAVCVE